MTTGDRTGAPPGADPGPGPIAMTVVGGYLGAGKTTLINRVLANAEGRIAVLVNEFGDIAVDESLVVARDGETMTLANGCICCSLVDGLAAALDQVRRAEPRPDRLLVETSGVSDPGTVAAYATVPGFVLDGVLVLVDVETVRRRAGDRYVGDMVRRQLRSADLLLVNKIDLVPADRVAEVQVWLAAQAPGIHQVAGVASRVPLSMLVGPSSIPGLPDTADTSGDAGDGEAGVDEAGGTGAGRAPGGATHPTDHGFRSWTRQWDRPLERGRVEAAMDDLPTDLHRVKGAVRLGSGPDDPGHWVVVRAVGARWTITPFDPAVGPDNGPGTMVVVGTIGADGDRWLDRLGTA
ncbi:MAG: CobW family GTP-binding protein [Acidimicrobiales bacterium]